jgi:hypothetical protein
MQDNQLIETRYVKLSQGNVLEVQLTQRLLDAIKMQFGINDDHVSDDHVRMFMWGSIKSALDKAEESGI